MGQRNLYELAASMGVRPSLVARLLRVTGPVTTNTVVEEKDAVVAVANWQNRNRSPKPITSPPEGSPAWVCNDCRLTKDPTKRLCFCTPAKARPVHDPRINPKTGKPLNRPFKSRNDDLVQGPVSDPTPSFNATIIPAPQGGGSGGGGVNGLHGLDFDGVASSWPLWAKMCVVFGTLIVVKMLVDRNVEASMNLGPAAGPGASNV